MNFNTEVFDSIFGARRLAQVQSQKELEETWKDVQQAFEMSWPRKGHALVFLIHDDNGRIGSEDVVNVLGKLNTLGKSTPVDVILHTRGGGASATEQIADALVRRRKTAAFVPYFAYSGGTEVALATELVAFGKAAVLGPTDLIIGGVPARDWVTLAEELGENAPADVRILARDAKRALRGETQRMCKLINRRHKGFLGFRGCDLARFLNEGDLHHGTAIGLKKARELHIRTSAKMPASISALVALRLEQLRRFRELELQITLVEKSAAGVSSIAA